jgi:hypothetical protein
MNISRLEHVYDLIRETLDHKKAEKLINVLEENGLEHDFLYFVSEILDENGYLDDE